MLHTDESSVCLSILLTSQWQSIVVDDSVVSSGCVSEVIRDCLSGYCGKGILKSIVGMKYFYGQCGKKLELVSFLFKVPSPVLSTPSLHQDHYISWLEV